MKTLLKAIIETAMFFVDPDARRNSEHTDSNGFILSVREAKKRSLSEHRKIDGYQDLEIGKIYNHCGIDFFFTFIVVQTDPKLVIQPLFTNTGYDFSDLLRGYPATLPNPQIYFKDVELYEAPNKWAWFVKTEFMSIEKAINKWIVSEASLKERDYLEVEKDDNGHWYAFLPIEKYYYENEWLESICITWNSKEEMEANLATYGLVPKEFPEIYRVVFDAPA